MCKIRFCDSSFKILTKLNEKSILKHLELCGRECYQSGAKTTKDSCYSFVKRLIDNSEGSVLEHSSFSVKFICTRSLSHQLVRHRLCAFSEQSQRYCNYATKVPIYFIIPLWIPENDREFLLNYTVDSSIRFTDLPDLSEDTLNWLELVLDSVKTYNRLIKIGLKPQEARSVLPNSTKTAIVCTTNIREWRHILKLRTSKRADPEIKELMGLLLKELKIQLPVLFNDIGEENETN